MKKFLIAFVFVVFASSSYAQDEIDNNTVSQEYSDTLQKMFKIAGTEETYKAALSQMFTMFKGQYPDVDPEIWDELKGDFFKTSISDLADMLVPVYAKYMTKEDLEAMIAFYETPVGQKFAKNTPLIMQESMQVGQQWGMKIGQEFEEKMKERGF